MTMCMAVASMIMSSNSTCPAYRSATSWPTSRKRPWVYFRMLALWANVTFFRPFFTA